MRFAIFAFLAAPALALADYGSATVDEIVSFYDGDTLTVSVHDWPPVIGERIKVRIAGIQAPERRSRCDTEAEKAREKALAADARIYLVERLRSAESVELRHIERGSFFRLVADVYADGEDVGQEMLARGLAIPYVAGEGGKAWCGR
ncbi:thermonuclease family protein [Halomonas sp. McH1-25]|uniref:thermonuclease family protein n=1 Tax=unclassified Halomonas TaxID=2609666 RepID=UPI001EF6EE98|nr:MULTISPECIES: thermonuclease family protein [unclassified Halomonas]MCG7598903.1 thermonuclease family protein [Halomonas sp. McH1-25]MCP1340866.1 thermonuclease family protein [Halomonas sp. FL8]MCP1361251.1 thermonuclease family protein [Halomonas sp. BBD45]MCP1366195.1 thermonuclease family protein [Halomonas sp. BBD48]